MSEHDVNSDNQDGGIDTVPAPVRPRVPQPPYFKVVLLNDDYTPMEFVVEVLVEIFNHPVGLAIEIMMDVHQHGKGVAGVYMREIAETKITQTHALARARQYPLRCELEQA